MVGYVENNLIALRQAMGAVPGNLLSYTNGRCTAWWADENGAVKTGGYKGLRNQSAATLTVTVHPVANFSATTGAKLDVILKVPAGETCFDLIFDEIVSVGSDALSIEHLFFPIALNGSNEI